MDASRPDDTAVPSFSLLPNLQNDPTPRDQAIYVPSVSPSYAVDAYTKLWPRRLPQGINPGDFDFLDPANPLFRLSHVLYSAGQALKQNNGCMITERDRKFTRVIGDSGGYQIANNSKTLDPIRDRPRILNWLETHCDLAMTLDVPTGPTRFENHPYRYKDFNACLAATLDHLDYFAANRTPGKVHFLSVLQGNNPREADRWYEAVKHYPFEGWAIAGVLRRNMYEVCRRVITMANDGLLQNKSWLHVLGTSTLEMAVMLTALQRAINKHINPHLRISYDTASPFIMLRSNKIFTLPHIDSSEMTLTQLVAPADPVFFGSKAKWPWPSALGQHLEMGDMCVQCPPTNGRYHDAQSDRYHAHHNLTVLCDAIDLAHRVFEVEMANPADVVHNNVKSAVAAIHKVIAARDLKVLKQYKPHLMTGPATKGVHPLAIDTGDEDRDLSSLR
jgi:hypothetical protein